MAGLESSDVKTAPASKPTHLEPSELGTREYWDNLYTTEIENHAADPTDTGTNWFDDSDAQEKVLEFLADSLPGLLGAQDDDQDDVKETASFLDLGTGNGALLFGLRDEGWGGPLLGVDYSAQSVEFAKKIAARRREEEEEEEEQSQEEEEEDAQGHPPPQREVHFQLHDILADPASSLLKDGQANGWDVVLDKGTFDAISLSSQTDPKGHRIAEAYRGRILPLMREGGLFLVTSCNWTEAELDAWFASSSREKQQSGEAAAAAAGHDADGGGEEEEEDEELRFALDHVGRVQYRSFSFGGVKGQTISTVCFRKTRRGPPRR